jgi:hypothetical protein
MSRLLLFSKELDPASKSTRWTGNGALGSRDLRKDRLLAVDPALIELLAMKTRTKV